MVGIYVNHGTTDVRAADNEVVLVFRSRTMRHCGDVAWHEVCHVNVTSNIARATVMEIGLDAGMNASQVCPAVIAL